MSIEITIVRSPGSVQIAKPCQIFTEQGGTIGRAPGNTWIIEDPDRFISSKHSQVAFENGYYYLLDLSTNGTFYNGSREPIGSGNRVVLKDGDRFTLGEYEFLVSMRNSTAASPFADPFGPGSFSGAGSAPPSETTRAGGHADNPFADPSGGLVSSIIPALSPGLQDTDPLAALDRANRIGAQTPFSIPAAPGVQRDDADPLQQAVKWPGGAIPENWDDDEAPGHARSPQAPRSPRLEPVTSSPPPVSGRIEQLEQKCGELEQENQKLLDRIAALNLQIGKEQEKKAATAPAAPVAGGDAALIEAMGLAKWELSGQKKAEISRVAGELVRECVAGLMQALTFRKKIKEEFRINVTTIQPVENNPLKFSANIEDALENLFVRDNKAYQKPLDAVREGFHGISEHQLAVLAGIQAAFRGMLDRLDPAALEQRFERYRKAGVIKVGQKSKNWDAYTEFHKELVNNLDNSFQHLFAYDFVQAYEDQLQRLLVARKSKNKSGE